METCDRLKDCGFFKKYQDRHLKACEKLIEEYCGSYEKSKSCARKKIFEQTGAPPSDDILPDVTDVSDI